MGSSDFEYESTTSIDKLKRRRTEHFRERVLLLHDPHLAVFTLLVGGALRPSADAVLDPLF
jgi:hypothetical protein